MSVSDSALSEFNDEIWKEIIEEENNYHLECNRWNDRILNVIGHFRGEDFKNDVVDCFQWAEATGDKFELVKEPSGGYQDDSFGKIKGIWVDQWSVGDSGDSYSGYIYIMLKRDKYLKIFYSC